MHPRGPQTGPSPARHGRDLSGAVFAQAVEIHQQSGDLAAAASTPGHMVAGTAQVRLSPPAGVNTRQAASPLWR